jgi:peroxiredoxin
MRKSLEGAARVVVVLPQSKAEADKTAKKLGIKAAVLADPDRKLIRSAKATHSLDLAVLDRNGRVVKRWNGLGRKEVEEANAELKKLGVRKSVPTAALPASSLSGCGI